MNKGNEEQLLRVMSDVLNQNGFRSEIMQEAGAPTLLRAEAARQGKVAKDVAFELSFLPVKLPGEESGLLRFYVTLFEHVPPENAKQLRRSCEYCNDFCLLGGFGFLEGQGRIYLKHSALIDGSLELEKNVTMIADNISLLLASVSRFIDGLAAVGFSGMPFEAALSEELFPQI